MHATVGRPCVGVIGLFANQAPRGGRRLHLQHIFHDYALRSSLELLTFRDRQVPRALAGVHRHWRGIVWGGHGASGDLSE